MRKALNENPMVQIGVLAIGVIAFALILMTSMGGGGSESTDATDPAAVVPDSASSDGTMSSPEDVPGAPPSSSADAVDPPASALESTSPGSSAPSAPPAAAGGSDSADGMLPSKGLPQDVLIAYAKGDAIALLVSNPRSLSDPRMKAAVRQLERRGDVSTFTVKAREIAKYSRITSGVSLSRVPALIVIRPRKLTDNVPTATVSYGFRGPESIKQALDDALYDGKQRAAYPE